MEKTLVIIKPDAVKRNLIGEIITRIEKKDLKIMRMKMVHLEKPKAEKHYAEHQGKNFYDELIEFIISGAVVLIVVEGKNAISIIRKIAGATDYLKAELGSIRGDYAHELTANLIHTSDSLESAKEEIENFFE